MVDVKAIRALANPVPLEAIRRNPALAEMILVKNSRLSVQPVTEPEWAAVLVMAGG